MKTPALPPSRPSTLAFVLAGAMALAAPALAVEPSTDADAHAPAGPVTRSVSSSYNPDDGTFSRTGRITFRTGNTLTYDVSGTCDRDRHSCDFTASAQGPLGGKWHAEGQLSRSGGVAHLKGELTTPAGRTIDIDRDLKGRHGLLRRLDRLDRFVD